ncbi:MAG: RluA family pseudouridine synthase [Phycisphaerae bacterium]|nr:RluA family pseudouridine synthase [Phycisphaerae bacterium]
MPNTHDSIPEPENFDEDNLPEAIVVDDTADPDGEIISVLCDDEPGEHFIITVGPTVKKKRLDIYLQSRFSRFSRSHIQTLIKEQGVNVNGLAAKASTKLSAGDKVDLIVPAPKSNELIAEDIPINVIYEDDDMIVLNKQADIIVHPARGNKSGTLVNGLVYYANQLSSINGHFRPGIVHRLDRNTTGVMVVAKNDPAHWQLAKQFADRTTQKTYIAVIHGVPQLTADCIDQPIGTNTSFRERMAVNMEGKHAVSFYKVLEEFRGYCVVELSPKTGRTHQLRVHMQYIKHPIVADDMYGGKVIYNWQVEDRPAAPEEPLINRTALHAWKLELDHPTTGKRMLFTADLPDDIQHLINNLREHRKIETKIEEVQKRKRPHDM